MTGSTCAAPHRPLLLPAATADDWLRTHLAAHLSRHTQGHDVADRAREWAAATDLLDTPGRLAALHAPHVERGATPQAAAKWICSWFAGSVARAVGYTLATASAALAPAAGGVRWRLDPGGWPDRLAFVGPDGSTGSSSVRVAVTAVHPWAGQDGVDVVASTDDVRRVAVETVTSVAEPWVQACRQLARVGRRALWTEVADELGLAVTFEPTLAADQHVVDELRAVVRTSGAPWRAPPSLRVDVLPGGPAFLGRKAGCCLAFQTGSSARSSSAATSVGGSADQSAGFCSTCPLRAADECARRQASWIEQRRAGVAFPVV